MDEYNEAAFTAPRLDTGPTFTAEGKEIGEKEEAAKGSTPLKGLEAQVAKVSPNAYALGRTLLDFVPFGKFAVPSVREEFSSLDNDEKITELAWEGVGLALVAGAPLVKPGLKAIGRVMMRTPKAPKILPIEDAVSGIQALSKKYVFKPFDYEKALHARLLQTPKGGGQGLAKDEAEAIFAVLHGADRGTLRNLQVQRAFRGKTPTKGWESTVLRTHEPYGGYNIKPEVVDALSETALRHRHFSRQMEKVLGQEVFGSKVDKGLVENVFKAQAERFWGPTGRTMTLGGVSDLDAANMVRDMLQHPKHIRALVSPLGERKWFAALSPTRTVFGSGEAGFQTFSKVFRPIESAFNRVNTTTLGYTMVWHKLLEQRSLGKIVAKKTGEWRFKPSFSVADEQAAFGIIQRIDDLVGKMPRGKTARSLALKQERQAEIQALINAHPPGSPVRGIIDSAYDLFDTLYAEYAANKLPQLFRKAGLSEYGSRALDSMMSRIVPRIQSNFATNASKGYAAKVDELKKIMNEVKAKLEIGPDTEVHPWFQAKGKDLHKTIQELDARLTLGKEGGFPAYLENYAPRLQERGSQIKLQWSNSIINDPQGFFTHARKAHARKSISKDFSSMIEARIRSQAKDLYMYGEIEEVVKHAKTLPGTWREYTEHFLMRAVGMPSVTDYKVARFMERTTGSLTGQWDEFRVMRLAQQVNDLVYLGALGFKPFSAIRNLFQPFLTVPADLGGITDTRHLVMGLRKTFDPKFRQWVKDIGAIGDYLPELHIAPRALPRGKAFQAFGKVRALPTIDRFRDVGMWMFRGSDRFNRYITAGAAANKWDKAISGIGRRVDIDNLKSFASKSGLKGRENYVRAEIEDLILRGRLDDAKAMFVKDVIADTQFLYGGLDTPQIISKYGGTGKSALLFQTWWMNYGSLVSKWLSTGTLDDRARRALAFYITGAMTMEVVEKFWGEGSAARTSLFGPFPAEVNEFLVPPTYTPLYRMVRVATAAGNLDEEKAWQQTKLLLDSLPVFVPGGLQIRATFQGAMKEGPKGVAKSLIKYNPSKRD